jgi:hypothetical protein
MSDKVTRKELLELLNQSRPAQINDIQLDELDAKAMEGYQYLDKGQHPEVALRNLDQKFDKWLDDKEVSKGKRVRKLNATFILQRVAAVVLLLLIPAIFIFKPVSLTKLVDRNFEIPRSTYFMVNRGENPAAETDIHNAFVLYEKGDYLAAAKAIEALKLIHPDKKDLKFYQAISLLAAGEVDQSIDLLLLCSQDNFQDLSTKSPWYLAMAYLKKGDKESAGKWLQQTLVHDSLHAQSAREILDQLQL